MASKQKVRDRQSTFIYDLPYSITRQICANLDVDRAWEKLASELNYSDAEVRQFGMAMHRINDSPMKQLLIDWGTRNPTASDLYLVLEKIKRRRESQLLEAYFADGVRPEKGTKNVPNHKASHMDSVPNFVDNTPSMILNALGNEALPKPKKSGKSVASSGNWSTSSVNSTHSSSGSNVNLNNPRDCGGKMSKKHVEDKDISSLNNGYGEKSYPGNYDYLSKMKENSGLSNNKKEKEHELASMSSEHMDKCEIDGPAGSIGNKCGKMADPSWMEALKSQDGYSTLAREGMSDVDIAVALMGSQSFTNKELNQATNGFSEEFKIGQGAFGEVFLGNLKMTKCAIKRLYQKQETNGDMQETQSHLKSELKTLVRYRHENIVPLYGYTLDGNEICLVYQYMQNGSLEDRLKCKDGSCPLSWQSRLSIMKGSACGLQYLHTLDCKPLIHGDIKSGNILLDKHMEPKIGDLGLAQHATGGSSKSGQLTHITRKQAHTKQYQCKAYLPPEVNRGNSMSTKGDTYSFGVVIYEVFTGEMAFDEKREGSQILVDYVQDYISDNGDGWRQLMDSKAGSCVDNIVKQFLSIGNKCTEKLKKNRPEMVQVYTQLENLEEQFKNAYPAKCTENVESACSSMQNTSISDNEMTRMDDFSFTSGQNYNQGVMAVNSPQSIGETGQSSYMGSYPPGGVAPQIRVAETVPEPLRMQMMYDSRKMGDPLPKESELKTPDTAEGNDYRNVFMKSDSRKLQEIKNFDGTPDDRNQDAVHCPQSPQCDPAKEQAIREFDDQNMKSNPSLYRSSSVEAVIEKLEKAKIEDNAFKHSADQVVDDSEADYESAQYQSVTTNQEYDYVETSEGSQGSNEEESASLTYAEDPEDFPSEVRNVGKKTGFGMMNLFENYNKAIMQLEGDDTSVEYCEEYETIVYNDGCDYDEEEEDGPEEDDGTLTQEKCDDENDDYLYGDQECSEGAYSENVEPQFVASEPIETTESLEYSCGENDSELFSEGTGHVPTEDESLVNDTEIDGVVSEQSADNVENVYNYAENNNQCGLHKNVVDIQKALWQQQRSEPSEGEG